MYLWCTQDSRYHRYHLCARDRALEEAAQRSCGASLTETDLQEPSGCNPAIRTVEQGFSSPGTAEQSPRVTIAANKHEVGSSDIFFLKPHWLLHPFN